VSWADELVIVDSGSADATAEIAKRFASRYVLEPWRGYTGQKRFGTTLCRNDWIFLLDGDEECSPPLAEEITCLGAAELDRYDVLLVRRRNYVMHRYVRAWSPDWQSRLFHRQRCRWPEEAVHDARLPSTPSRRGRLRGWIEHKRWSQGGFADYFNGQLTDARLALLAEQMYRRGKRCGWMDLCLRPVFAFVKFYFLRRGFLDGRFGLLIAQKAAGSVQLKYAALWAYQEALKPSSTADAENRTRRCTCSPPS
jgi:glycosyltransferase involved in cell wall biosynthesis